MNLKCQNQSHGLGSSKVISLYKIGNIILLYSWQLQFEFEIKIE